MDDPKMYKKLLKQYPEVVSKEQFRIMCHISKRTACYLLQSGLVPCIQTGKKSCSYKIRMKDIIHYMKLREKYPGRYKPPKGYYMDTTSTSHWLAMQNRELPPGVTTSKLKKYYSEKNKAYPDLLNVRQVSEIAGYCTSVVLKWIHSHELPALPVGNSHLVPKHILIEYMAGEAYRNRIPKSKKQYEDIGGYWVWEQEKSSSLQTKKEA